MKTLLIFLIAATISVQLTAQAALTVSVDIQYRIDPTDSLKKSSPFFLSRLNNSFSTNDVGRMLDMTASRILQITSSGDSLQIIQPYSVGTVFSTGTKIVDCRKYKPMDFQTPSNEMQTQPSWMNYYEADYFRRKGFDAVSDNLMVLQDKKIVCSVDTSMVEKKGKSILKLNYNYLDPKAASTFFIENWKFDPSQGHFEKTVKYYGYFEPKFDMQGEWIGRSPVFGIANNEVKETQPTRLTLLKKNVVCDVAIHWPEQMMVNDTAIQKYSGADAVEYLNSPDGNIPEADRAKFLAAIFSFAFSHPENVFSESNMKVDSLDKFSEPIRLQSEFSKTDSLETGNDKESNDPQFRIITSFNNLYDVYALRFYEDWYYDATDFTMKKIVRGVGIILLDITNIGEPVIRDSGIYIRMN